MGLEDRIQKKLLHNFRGYLGTQEEGNTIKTEKGKVKVEKMGSPSKKGLNIHIHKNKWEEVKQIFREIMGVTDQGDYTGNGIFSELERALTQVNLQSSPERVRISLFLPVKENNLLGVYYDDNVKKAAKDLKEVTRSLPNKSSSYLIG